MYWEYIDSDAALAEQCRQWRDVALLAIDTEFIRTDTFYPILGLIQVGDGEAQYLLDPLRIDDWAPFTALLRDAAIPKVLHAASEDLEVLQRHLGCVPQPLLDTQTGAALAGYPFGLSYQNLVEQCLGEHVPKGETRSDWLQRPLSESQCRYAALDVEHLPAVYRHLKARLDERGRYAWWLEEGAVTVARADAPAVAAEYYQRVKSAWKLSRRQQAVLQKICVWREAEARERDRPRGRILKDHVCVDIARIGPSSLAELADVRDMPPPVLRKYGDTLLALVREGEAVADGDLPPPLPEPLPRSLAEKLKTLRKVVEAKSAEYGIPAEVLARKRELEALLRCYAETGAAPELPAELRGWREPLIGQALLEALETA